MTSLTCSQLRRQLHEIKSLKADFDVELRNLNTTRNTAPALRLEKDMKEKICLIDGSFFCLMGTAEKILGQDMLGPDAIEAAFGFKPEIKDIPPILFSRVELERAKKLEQFLILRIDKSPAGQLLTMKSMNKLKKGKTKDGGKIIHLISWYKNEKFFTAEPPVPGWALVSKEVIPNSTDKNYLEQTEEIAKYLTKVFKGQAMPLQYQEAINDFNKAKNGIRGTLFSNPMSATTKLAQLKINQLFRHTPSEVLYDILLRKENNREYFLPSTYAWANTRAERLFVDAQFIFVGCANSDGLGIGGRQPNDRNTDRGVCFSHRR